MSVKSHPRLFAATLATLCIPLSVSAATLTRPAGAFASGTATAQVQSKVGDTPADFGKIAAVPSPKAGDTPADFGRHVVVPSPKAGDTPIDDPGASRAPESRPVAPVQIVRPTRTIVRDSNPALPIILAGLALLIALAAAAQMVAQRRTLQARAH